jgi:hypothetical protein
MTSRGERRQVAGSDQQRCAENRSEPGHRLDHCRLGMLREGVLDLLVQQPQPLVLSQDGGGELGDDAGRHVLPGEHRLLGLSGGDRSCRDICVGADPALPQPS